MKNDKVNMKEILSIMEGILSMHEQLIKNQHKLIERIDHLDNHVYIMSDRMLALQTKCDKLLEDRNMAIIKGDDVVDIDVYRNNVRRLIDADVEAKAEEEVKKRIWWDAWFWRMSSCMDENARDISQRIWYKMAVTC